MLELARVCRFCVLRKTSNTNYNCDNNTAAVAAVAGVVECVECGNVCKNARRFRVSQINRPSLLLPPQDKHNVHTSPIFFLAIFMSVMMDDGLRAALR